MAENAKNEAKRQPHRKQYKFVVKGVTYKVSEPTILGRDILKISGHEPVEQWLLTQIFRKGGTEKIDLNQEVNLEDKGRERFHVTKLIANEGEALHNADLPENDVDFLNRYCPAWSTHRQGNQLWLMLPGFEVPDGYNHDQVEMALLIPSGYGGSQIDMAYFYPALSRADGKPIKQLVSQAIGGRNFQRWSRHRPGSGPGAWQPGIDNVSTHVGYVSQFLLTELQKHK